MECTGIQPRYLYSQMLKSLINHMFYLNQIVNARAKGGIDNEDRGVGGSNPNKNE